MKKQLIIIGIVALLVCVGLSGCSTEQYKQTHLNIKYNGQLKPNENPDLISSVDVSLKIYDNIENWQLVDPIVERISKQIDEKNYQDSKIHLSDSNSYRTTISLQNGKTYVVDIWYWLNPEHRTMPDGMVGQHFYGTFSTDETLAIQTTGYITKSDGSLLSNTPP
jgi:hypothetical protein